MKIKEMLDKEIEVDFSILLKPFKFLWNFLIEIGSNITLPKKQNISVKYKKINIPNDISKEVYKKMDSIFKGIDKGMDSIFKGIDKGFDHIDKGFDKFDESLDRFDDLLDNTFKKHPKHPKGRKIK